jgi:hypothetical protein
MLILPDGDEGWWILRVVRSSAGDQCLISQGGRVTMPIEQKVTEQKVTLDEVLEVMGGEVRKAVDKYFDFLQKAVSSYPLGDTELGGKAKDCAEKNITIARDYVHKLSRVTNFLEIVPIHTEFMQSQLGFMGEQIKGLGEVYTKAATEMLNAPLPTDSIENSVKRSDDWRTKR